MTVVESKSRSWVSVGKAVMSRDLKYILIVVDGELCSCLVADLFDLIDGYRMEIDVKGLSR